MQLREYPIQFGREIADLFDSLTTTARGLPPLPNDLPAAVVSYEALSDQFGMGYAALQQVFDYLRRGKHLKIPAEWASVIPRPS